MFYFRSESKEKLEKYSVEFKKVNNSIADVINNSLKYFVSRAKRNQYLFFAFNIILLLINGSVLVLNYAEADRIWVTVFSAVATLVTALIALFRYTDNWRRYRTNAEKLKSQCIRFKSGSGDYAKITDEEEREQLLVEKFIEICEEDMGELREIIDVLKDFTTQVTDSQITNSKISQNTNSQNINLLNANLQNADVNNKQDSKLLKHT